MLEFFTLPGFSSDPPPRPAPPPAPPPAPAMVESGEAEPDPEVEELEEELKADQKRRGGRRRTIMTSPLGVAGEPEVRRNTLLGE